MNVNDMWLILFFLIQLIYIVLCVFLPLPDGDDKAVIDVVMRTSTAVLAGYFLSKNFVAVKQVSAKSDEKKIRKSIQSNVVGALGLFSLALTITVRYVEVVALPYTVISQLRDFYLASVAFLMGTAE